MKKVVLSSLILLMVVFMALSAVSVIAAVDAATMTDEEIAEAIKQVKVTVIGINELGFIAWVKANLLVFILAVVGAGRVLVSITPTKKDDKWYGKWILKPVRMVLKVLALEKPS